MSEEVKPKVDEEPEPEPKPEPIAPAERFKDDPTYKAMAKQLAELQREREERRLAEAQAAKDAELKALEEKGQYEEALKKRQQEIEDLKAEHAREILQSSLKTELIRHKFDNDIFVAGAITAYKPDEHGSVSDYVKALAEDEANKRFLSPESDPVTGKKAPVKAAAMGDTVDWNQIKLWEHSEKREERIKARDALKRYRESHNGEYPY